jgi:hypothetical protein
MHPQKESCLGSILADAFVQVFPALARSLNTLLNQGADPDWLWRRMERQGLHASPLILGLVWAYLEDQAHKRGLRPPSSDA